MFVDPDDVDVGVTGTAEDHLPGRMIGPLFHAVLVDQFTRLGDGPPTGTSAPTAVHD